MTEKEGIILKGPDGKDAAYYGIETIAFDTTTEGKQQVFTKGVAVEGLEIVPDFTGGDMSISADNDMLVKSAVIRKPDDLSSENIRKGKVIAGVEGTFIGDTEELIIGEGDGETQLNFSEVEEIVLTPAVEDKVFSKVTVKKPEGLKPENIAKDVEICGVVGKHKGGDHQVNYMNDDGTETLFNYPIMHGDSRGDVITLGLMETPTKETTEYEEHIFLGWAVTIGGAVETAMFENVTEDLTVYAVFKTVAIVASGVCGDNATWRLNAEGVLTVSGEGDMTNYTTSARPPWYDYVSTIKTISIKTGVTSIGNYAFQNCTALTTIVLPESLTSVGAYAFGGCTALMSVSLPNGITSIGNYTFQNCTALTTIVLPDSATYVSGYMFDGCTALTSITIPDGVTGIRDYAFQNCRGLTKIDIPASVTSIDNYPFNGCTSLTAINVATDNTTYCSTNGVLYSADMTSIIRYPSKKSGTSFTIPSGVTLVDNGAFESCASLTSLTIPNGVTKIGGYAFKGCSGLTRITIPSSVVYIGTEAFGGTSLTSATFAVTTGWSVWMAGIIKIGDLTSSSLANTSTAATYLKTTYAAMTTWQRS